MSFARICALETPRSVIFDPLYTCPTSRRLILRLPFSFISQGFMRPPGGLSLTDKGGTPLQTIGETANGQMEVTVAGRLRALIDAPAMQRRLSGGTVVAEEGLEPPTRGL